MTISPAQCVAARGLVGWSQAELANAALCGRATIASFEQKKRTPQDRTIRDIVAALEAAGVVFIEPNAPSMEGGRGVRCRSAD